MKDFCSEKGMDSHLGKNEKKFLFRVFVLSPVLSLPKGAFVMIFSFFGIEGLRIQQ